jgi:hypothetical protein
VFGRKHSCLWAILAVCGLLFFASSAPAYIGPGSGVEFIGYFLSLLAWVGAAFFSIMMWPLYAFIQRLRGKRSPPSPPPPTAAPQDEKPNETEPPAP